MSRREGSRPSWSSVAGVAAAGALLLALFVAVSGSVVAVAAALLCALVLGAIALISFLRRRPLAWPRPARRPSPPRLPAAMAIPTTPEARTPVAPQPLPDTPATVLSLARQLAQQAVDHASAPASSVLIPRGRRLMPAGTAGDWALARQLQAETQEPKSGWMGWAGSPSTDGDPPEFPLDEVMPVVLAIYPRAVPVERWRELEDAPAELLPLAGLADRGVAVAIPLNHTRRLAGLWVLARRPQGRSYSDAELRALERLAHQAVPALAAALTDDPG
jgi:hypothetical protein